MRTFSVVGHGKKGPSEIHYSKINQKLSKMLKMWILACALATWFLENGLGEGFERILEGFLVDFEGCGPHC